ncbi:hypothetical protein [Paraburkholderia flagellata]|uniref:hypothetical protein n=1 Tax=Paraburkholderia flagellata TaxID=2883241 RepID=UPI001F1FC334|nr:hypothetical protein [Paraburkholderia flagellata]
MTIDYEPGLHVRLTIQARPLLCHAEAACNDLIYASRVPFLVRTLRIDWKKCPAGFHSVCIDSAISDKFSLIADIA